MDFFKRHAYTFIIILTMIVLFLVYVPSGERVNVIKGIICSSILYGGMDGGVCGI